jgi:ribosomal protein L32
MGRAQIRFEANEPLAIDGRRYRVAEHPALSGIPYVQRGGRGFVVQLIDAGGERIALKYFKLKYRVPDLVRVAGALRRYADLPGLRAAHRIVFTQANHADLLTNYPALEYGMLMPWLPGLTWYDLVTTRAPISAREAVRLAQVTGDVLAGLEARGLAHCDIAGGNVMVDRRAMAVHLVDIEEMYGPDLPRPIEAPAGQDGYQHRTSREHGQWSPEGDRFGAAVLLAEILGWTDGRVRVNSADEHFFSAVEMQDSSSTRFRLLYEVLRDQHGAPLAELFEAAWHSERLDDCPPVRLWREALAALDPDSVEERAATPAPASSTVVSGRRAVGRSAAGAAQDNAALPAGAEDHLNLTGMRLCRNCGESNTTRDTFCKRCGFYIGTGARKPLGVMLPMNRPPGASGAAPTPVLAPPPQPIPLNRDLNEVVTARRMGSPGGLRRVEAPRPPEETVEANAGAWLVIVLILGVVFSIIVLALISG